MNGSKKDILVRFSGYISVGMIAIAFVFVGLLTISKTGRTVNEIIIESALGFIVGMLIDSILGMQGINNGKQSKLYLDTKSLHGETVESISPHIHLLDSWCRRKNADNLRRQRTKILMNEELAYENYFDENGKAKGYTPIYKGKDKEELRRERARKRAYRKALRLKLTPLSTAALTAEGANPDDPFNFGETEGEYERHSLMSDALKKGFTALIFGYYCVEQVLNFSYAALLWRVLQISIHLVSGVFKMLAAQSFIVNNQRAQIVRKINHLSAFKNDITEGKLNVSDEVQRNEL
jgi:hypothetical protein